MGIYKKLHEIQKAVFSLQKDGAGTSYKYLTGDKLLSHIKPLMNDLGLILKQEIISIENTRQDYIVGAGTNRERQKSEILTKVMMRFTWVDIETGEKDENLFGANGQNDWDKGVGSALTYGERYFIMKYFHIPTDEDDVDNPNRKNLKWAQTEDLKQCAYNFYTIEQVRELYKIRPEQEKEYNELLERYMYYNDINNEIQACKTTEELKKVGDNLKHSEDVYNDFKAHLNEKYKQLINIEIGKN